MKRLFSSLVITLILCGPLLGQSERTYTISGVVKDSRGAVIVSAKVYLLTWGHQNIPTVTDNDGKFLFRDLPAGQYILTVHAQGFGEISEGVHLSADSFHEIILPVGESRYSVTAEIGQSEDRANIPQPVNIIGPSDVKDRVTSFLAQAGEEEVGLNVQRTSPTLGAIVVRGLTGKNVVHYVDGVRYTNGAQRGGINTFFNLNDGSNLEAIEVLRGPNSAQYGSDSLGGTVNLITKSPAFGETAEFHGELIPMFNSADRSFGSSALLSYGTRKFGGYVNVFGRKVGTLRTADGIDSHSAITRFLGLRSDVLYDRNPETGFEHYGGAFRLNYTPSDDQQLVLFYQRGQQDGGKRFDQLLGGDGNLVADLRNLMLDFGYLRYVKQEFLGFDSVSATVSYNSQREERVNQGGQGNPVGDITHQYERTSVTGFNFHLDRQLPAGNTFLFGGDVYHEWINSPAYIATVTNVVTLSRPRVPDEATFDSAGVFVQDAWCRVRENTSFRSRFMPSATAGIGPSSRPALGRNGWATG